jgi:hypothetical protein
MAEDQGFQETFPKSHINPKMLLESIREMLDEDVSPTPAAQAYSELQSEGGIEA